MSDFFTKLKKGIDKGTAIVGAKSTTVIETTKLKQDISTTNRVKKEALTELGTKIYEMNKNGEVNLESVEPIFTRIAQAEDKIDDINAKIKIIQDEEKEKLDKINEDQTPERPVEAEATVVESEIVEVEVEEIIDEKDEPQKEEEQEQVTGEYKG